MIIYKVTNNINGKIYIGQTKRTLEKRWSEHCNKYSDCASLHNAILEYGKENFSVVQIDCAIDKEELNAKEKYWIQYYDSVNKGYNLTYGGTSRCGLSDEIKTQISEKVKEAWKDGWIEAKPMSKETKKKISEAHKGSKNHRARKVRCVETGEIFDTLSEAAKKYNLYRNNISLVCTGTLKTTGGYHWEYV